MSRIRSKYVLGQDVTSSARSKVRTGSAVLSVRLSTEEMMAVEAASMTSGKSVAQVVRDAINTYLYFERSGAYSITVSGPLGTLSTGHVWSSGKAVQRTAEVIDNTLSGV